jgi:uncharacterized protein YfaS (alpha-2-macroglobulin family)
VLLVDLLPAGFEIESAEQNSLADLTWLGTLSKPSRQEGRDDRFMAAFELAEQNDFNVAYMVRAVTSGIFSYPPTYVEAMYQPAFFTYGEEQKIIVNSE